MKAGLSLPGGGGEDPGDQRRLRDAVESLQALAVRQHAGGLGAEGAGLPAGHYDDQAADVDPEGVHALSLGLSRQAGPPLGGLQGGAEVRARAWHGALRVPRKDVWGWPWGEAIAGRRQGGVLRLL